MELIQPHKIKQEPGAIAVNDDEIYNKQQPIDGDKTDLKIKGNINLEPCQDTDQSMFSPHSIGQTMNPYYKVDNHPSSNEEKKFKISNILTNLVKVPQSDGNLVIKSTPTYHSRPYLREVVKYETDSAPISHLEGLKLDSSSVDLNQTAKNEQYIPPMIINNLKTSEFVFMKKEANTSPDECSHEEIDHSSDLCCDQQLLDDSISISTADSISIDNSFKKQNSMVIVLNAEEVKDYEDTNKVIKSNFSHPRQFQMDYSETQTTQNTQVQKSFENSKCALGNSKDKVVITNKRKTYSESKKGSETKRSPRRSARCLQRELKLGKSLVNSTEDDRENQQTQNSLGKNFIGENISPKTVPKGSSRTSKRLTSQSKSELLTNSKNTDNGSGDIEVDTLKDKSEESQVKELKSRDKICQLKLKDKRYSALSSKTAKQVTKNILHQCQICNDIFKNVEQLRCHVVKHLKTSISKEATEMGYSCSICQSVLPSVKCFNEHLQVHDSDILKLTEVKPKGMLKCKICFLAFYGNVTLNAHQTVHEFTKWNPPSIENFRKITICYFCGKESRDIANLKVHLRIHTGEKPYKCTQCAKTFACQSSLTKHLASHKETKDHVCDVCGKAFRLPSKLKRHRKIHFKNIFNMLPCLYCNKTFMRRSEIREHEKSFHFNIYDENKAKTQCPNCLKYIVKRAFKEHCKTHQQRVRSFHCETCKKSFLSRKILLKHAKSHAADRKYICEYCGKIYMDKLCFTRHTLDHSKTKSLSCVCGLELNSKNLLNAHKLECPFKHACVRSSSHIDAIEKVYTKNKYSKEKLETNKKECPICYKLVSPNYFLSAQKKKNEKKKN